MVRRRAGLLPAWRRLHLGRFQCRYLDISGQNLDNGDTMASVDGPLPERLQHDRVTRDEQQLADAEGNIGLPWRVEGLLHRLERHGDIGPRERLAGEEFARLFHHAQMAPLRAGDMLTPLHRPAAPAIGTAFAQRNLNLAFDALGGLDSPCGACAWFVLGLELSMRDWALREGWAGRAIRQEVAKGVLLGTLGTLAKHFGV